MEYILSTGTFIGIVNGRNPYLLPDYYKEFDVDGFEFMIFPSFYPILDDIIDKCVQKNIKTPVMHFDKDIGNGIGSPDETDYEKSLSVLDINLNAAKALGAKKAVIHLWGRKDSDLYPEIIYKRAGEIDKICKNKGVLPVFENIFCTHGSPLKHLENLSGMYPEMRFIMDCRPAQFHGELEKTLRSPIMQKTSHLHVNDYLGGYMEWEKVNPIKQPRDGIIDWNMYFSLLKAAKYNDTVTLEAPSPLAEGVDAKTLNGSICFLRENLG